MMLKKGVTSMASVSRSTAGRPPSLLAEEMRSSIECATRPIGSRRRPCRIMENFSRMSVELLKMTDGIRYM